MVLTYSMIAGWGVTFTLLVATVVWLIAKQIQMQHKIFQLENRIITAEREYNIKNPWPLK